MESKGFGGKRHKSRANQVAESIVSHIDSNLYKIAAVCVFLSVSLIGFTSGVLKKNTPVSTIKVVEKINTQIFINHMPDKTFVKQEYIVAQDEPINFTAKNPLPKKVIFKEHGNIGYDLKYDLAEATICGHTTSASFVEKSETAFNKGDRDEEVILKSVLLTEDQAKACKNKTRTIGYAIDGAIVPFGHKWLGRFLIWPDEFYPEVRENKIDIYLPDRVNKEDFKIELEKFSGSDSSLAQFITELNPENNQHIIIKVTETLATKTGLRIGLSWK